MKIRNPPIACVWIVFLVVCRQLVDFWEYHKIFILLLAVLTIISFAACEQEPQAPKPEGPTTDPDAKMSIVFTSPDTVDGIGDDFDITKPGFGFRDQFDFTTGQFIGSEEVATPWFYYPGTKDGQYILRYEFEIDRPKDNAVKEISFSHNLYGQGQTATFDFTVTNGSVIVNGGDDMIAWSFRGDSMKFDVEMILSKNDGQDAFTVSVSSEGKNIEMSRKGNLPGMGPFMCISGKDNEATQTLEENMPSIRFCTLNFYYRPLEAAGIVYENDLDTLASIEELDNGLDSLSRFLGNAVAIKEGAYLQQDLVPGNFAYQLDYDITVNTLAEDESSVFGFNHSYYAPGKKDYFMDAMVTFTVEGDKITVEDWHTDNQPAVVTADGNSTDFHLTMNYTYNDEEGIFQGNGTVLCDGEKILSFERTNIGDGHETYARGEAEGIFWCIYYAKDGTDTTSNQGNHLNAPYFTLNGMSIEEKNIR